MNWLKRLFGLKPRAVTPKPFQLPPKPVGQARTVAEQLDALCAHLKCSYERDYAGTQIRLSLVFPNGERLCGQGYTTLEAYSAVLKRAKEHYSI